MPKFAPEFDTVAVALSITAIVILLYYGIAIPGLATQIFVAFCFWLTGFFYAMVFCKRTKILSFGTIFTTVVFVALAIVGLYAINVAFGLMLPNEVYVSQKLLSSAIGVSEELFFGVFLLCVMINFLQLNPVIAIIISAGVHTGYHSINWGTDPKIMLLFFACFVSIRTMFVFVWPKIGLLLGAHGIWNFGVD